MLAVHTATLSNFRENDERAKFKISREGTRGTRDRDFQKIGSARIRLAFYPSVLLIFVSYEDIDSWMEDSRGSR